MSGVVSAGLSTTVFPQASAGAIFHAAMSSGKFQGMICPATPSGCGFAPGTRTRACRPSPRSRRSARRRAAGRRRGFPDRLAAVDRLEHGEFAGALLHQARDAEQVLGALGGGSFDHRPS